MSGVETRAGYVESPVFFDAGDNSLFGIVTQPSGPMSGVGIILMPGAGTPLTTDRNRLAVRISRGLAEMGHTVLRFDYHGAGESAGSIERFDLAHPFVHDCEAAVAWLRSAGVSRIAMVGQCFGARTALATAAKLDGVESVVLMATQVRDFALGERLSANTAMQRSVGRYLREAVRPRTIRGLFRSRNRHIYRKYARAKLRILSIRVKKALGRRHESPSWMHEVSPGFLKSLERLVDRGVRTHFVFGTEEDSYADFQTARDGSLAPVLERAGSGIQVTTIPGRIHGFVSVEVQDAAFDLVMRWAEELRRGPEVSIGNGAG